MGSHIVSCYPTQVNAPPRHNPSSVRPVFDLCIPDRGLGRLSWPWCWLLTEMVHLSADSHPFKWPDPTGS